ncbi:hypothetical protein GUJ93_ZPchr0002g24150 [Zizania palustris]|uniref:Uncharacterized protein n=1 Tax=Zizania palustris TaxID=103762 RepID=A0A8J5SK11_ZIZPA|nr:hypothetical protein GUJ93_ZPchr0002g24150 [Zizania palustris]
MNGGFADARKRTQPASPSVQTNTYSCLPPSQSTHGHPKQNMRQSRAAQQPKVAMFGKEEGTKLQPWHAGQQEAHTHIYKYHDP